jgi:hypothetical protein
MYSSRQAMPGAPTNRSSLTAPAASVVFPGQAGAGRDERK